MYVVQGWCCWEGGGAYDMQGSEYSAQPSTHCCPEIHCEDSVNFNEGSANYTNEGGESALCVHTV